MILGRASGLLCFWRCVADDTFKLILKTDGRLLGHGRLLFIGVGEYGFGHMGINDALYETELLKST